MYSAPDEVQEKKHICRSVCESLNRKKIIFLTSASYVHRSIFSTNPWIYITYYSWLIE